MPPSSSNYTINHLSNRDESSMSPSSSTLTDSLSIPKTRLEARDVIISSLIQILEQPLAMLRDGTVGDEQMSAESHLIPGSSFGKHLRHVHDHYRVLLDAVDSSASSIHGEALPLDYDKRVRAPPLERSAKRALKEFEDTQKRIKSLFGDEALPISHSWERSLDRKVLLTATTPEELEVGSTLGREMWFVCLHAIHHFALARVILVHELRLSIEDEFGVAPSTLLFREWNKASQPKL
ncbi:hypothetical protein CBS101457_003764 [Exobasidium rhododendri]|nr:hypothetical protein CBS101457_003764 [Exobasidium rhododendri]